MAAAGEPLLHRERVSRHPGAWRRAAPLAERAAPGVRRWRWGGGDRALTGGGPASRCMHRARGSGAGEDDWGQQLAPVSDESDNGTGDARRDATWRLLSFRSVAGRFMATVAADIEALLRRSLEATEVVRRRSARHSQTLTVPSDSHRRERQQVRLRLRRGGGGARVRGEEPAAAAPPGA